MDRFDEMGGTQSLVGYNFDRLPDGGASCSLQVGAQHLNRQGILHGGITAMLLDNALGASASLAIDPSGSHPCSTMTLNIAYLAPGQPGLVTATGQLVGGGAKVKFVQGELRHQDGTLIATATGAFRKMHKTPG